MKRFFIYIGIVGGIVSCRPAGPRLQHGDLLFQVGAASEMSGAIAAATGKENNLKYTHVGIVLAENGVDSVLEATSDAGVRIVPLKDFLARSARIGGASAVTAMRLRDTAGVAASVRRARQFVGQPYDYSYRVANGKMYCSELVWESYRDTLGVRIFPAQEMNFRAADGTMPRFWVELFERLGEPIPEGEPGTNPNDMAREAVLEEVGRYF